VEVVVSGKFGHLTVPPKSAMHMTTGVLFASLPVVFQVAVSVPSPIMVPSTVMLIGTMALPHTVTEQV